MARDWRRCLGGHDGAAGDRGLLALPKCGFREDGHPPHFLIQRQLRRDLGGIAARVPFVDHTPSLEPFHSAAGWFDLAALRQGRSQALKDDLPRLSGVPKVLRFPVPIRPPRVLQMHLAALP